MPSARGRTRSSRRRRQIFPVVTLSERFAAALTLLAEDEHLERSDASEPAESGLLPDRLCLGCTQVLPVAAAGLSFTFSQDRRLPVGASSPAAATAERLQFALGDGPCLTAHESQTTASAGWAELHRRWPVYATELAARTAFRSVVALPVPGWLGNLVTLELYSTAPEVPTTVRAADVETVAGLVGEHLVDDMTRTRATVLGQPAWLVGDAATQRHRVWLAIGMLKAQWGGSSAHALTRLRGHAFSHGTDLETAAGRILGGELPTG